MSDPLDRLPFLDQPRPLSAGLRERLADALLSAPARPLSEDQTSILRTALEDPVGELLAGLDTPRPLPAAARARLDHTLARPRHRWLPVGGAAGMAAAVAVAVAVLVLPSHHSGQVTSLPTPSSTPLGSGGTAGADAGTTGGTTGTSAVAAPPAVAPAAGGISQGVTPPTGSSFSGGVAGSGAAGQTPAPTASPAATPSASPVPSRPPAVDGISPSSGPAGTWVTLTGHDLVPTRAVTFGTARAARVMQVSSTEVRALAPAHMPGPVDVVLTTAAGSSAPRRYVYLL